MYLLFKCPKFLKLSPKDRFEKIRGTKICINCFRRGHNSKTCTRQGCGKCSKKHNTLLHFEGKPTGSKTTLVGSAVTKEEEKHVFLATALINVKNNNGIAVQVRALLDSGSQLNLMTNKMHRKLGLRQQSSKVKISGIGSSTLETNNRAHIEISSAVTRYNASLEVYLVHNITSCQPTHRVDITGWNIPKNITLADKQFNIPAAVDLIIGGELFFKILSIGQIAIGESLPDLQNTVFGWVVTGKLLGLKQNNPFVGISSLEQQVAKFWAIEEKFQEDTKFNELEEKCEQFFEETTTRDKSTGKFVVKLQFLKEPSTLGSSEEMAIRRFLYLEKRFKKDPDMKSDYVNFMREYENLGHMKEVARHNLGNEFYVIPHHAVRNPASSTTKFRVVFDASAKTTTNISLNEILANGPMLQEDLFSIMCRFRTHQYVFSADITKMYRQVIIHEDDQQWQTIVWREEYNKPLKYYKLLTVTYGTTCASYLAIKSLQQLAMDNENKYPLGATVAKRDFNVDDIMTGSNNLKEAVETQRQLIKICNSANFILHKWCANNPALLENIPKSKQEVSLDINTEKTETKALGMKWIPKDDTFQLAYNPRDHSKITKRTVLAETAQLFDPLGIVNPVIVLAKIFLQELWSLKLDWDAALPLDLHNKWLQFREQLKELNEISIDRKVIIKNPVNIQLHTFSDASIRAYGTVAYIRSQNADKNILVSLLCSKSRVAPISSTTLPRLELCAGVLMVDLAEKLEKILGIKFNSTTNWTDSELVLSWLQSDTIFKTFVANRVAKIKRKTNSGNWRYVNTKLNPADLISRGIFPKNLIKSELWWKGPAFLWQSEDQWPQQKANFIREVAEEKTMKAILMAQEKDDAPQKDQTHPLDQINHRNSIRTMQRVVAYCLKFKKQQKTEPATVTSNLTVEELKKALIVIIKHCQKQGFKHEINLVRDGKNTKTRFSNFVPIIDADGVLRVGGRLGAANVPFEQKHPAILPKNHLITRMIMERIHLENMHAGPQALLAITRQRYWPENGKALAHTIVKDCVLCTRSKPKLLEQIMGDLPANRVTPARPFEHVGMDFAGPYTVIHRIRGKRPTPAYVCIFICFVTKAVHIEAAVDYSTEAFIRCLKRFIARRGLPRKISCDNATNFVGANNQLLELKKLMENPEHIEQVEKYCLDHHIIWQFIPPRSPHFGGLHEAAVKSAKHHLKKVLHSTELTLEELMTILAEIEAILNSRPLTPMSNNPSDLQPLTAGHFLIGTPMNCILDHEMQYSSKTKIWNKITTIRNEFWKRWSTEYLAELQNRTKWTKEKENVKIGTMVILREDNVPPLKWKMGRIVNTISGKEGKVRVVEVKTTSGSGDKIKTIILKRSIHQVAPLPIEQEDPEKQNIQTTDLETAPRGRKITRKKLNPQAQAFEPVSSRLRTRANKKFVGISQKLWTTIITIFILLFGTLANKCEVTSFEHNPGLYFEECEQMSITNDECSIIAFLKLEDYWNRETMLSQVLNRMDNICTQSADQNQCNVTQKQLSQQFDELLTKDEIIKAFSHKMRKRRGWNHENIHELSNQNTTEETSQNITTNKQLAANTTASKSMYDNLSFMRKLVSVSRKRRGWINIIGSGLKMITGVMDEDDAKHYEEEIKRINDTAAFTLKLIANQTTIQDLTKNIIKHNEDGIIRQLEDLEKEVNNSTAKDEEAKFRILTSLTTQAMALLQSHKELQNILIEMLTQIQLGKVSTTIINPLQLEKHLNKIASTIPKDLMIPGYENIENLAKIYSIMQNTITVTSEYIILKINLPLVNREFFKLYHIIPVPFNYQEKTMDVIETSYQYMAVNTKQNRYYMLTYQQYKSCKKYSDDMIICEQDHPIYNTHMGETKCEMAILTHTAKNSKPKCVIKKYPKKQIWLKLRTSNHFLYSVQNKTNINIICINKAKVCQLEMAGIINLPQQCIIQTQDMEIASHNIRRSEIAVLIEPKVNLTDIIKESIFKQHEKKHSMEFTMDTEMDILDKAIQRQKKDELAIPAYTWHDVHHYTVLYIILTFIVIMAIWYLWGRCTCNCNNRPAEVIVHHREGNPTQNRRANHPMTDDNISFGV